MAGAEGHPEVHRQWNLVGAVLISRHRSCLTQTPTTEGVPRARRVRQAGRSRGSGVRQPSASSADSIGLETLVMSLGGDQLFTDNFGPALQHSDMPP